MFCPNCGNETNEQNFCRQCGLRVEKILKLLVKEIEEKEKTDNHKRDDWLRKLGFILLSLCFGICFSLIFFLAAYYKFVIFGQTVMIAISLATAILFAFLSLIFFNLPKFLKTKQTNEKFTKADEIEEARITDKLLAEGIFNPIPSVTENSTELLFVEKKRQKSD
jgi:uncharacterized membrane protein YvbJ